MKIKISLTNSKLGLIPSISLPPIKTCRCDAPCTKDCYAMRGHYLYKNVKESLQVNLDCYYQNANEYFLEIEKFLDGGIVTYKYFRWHSAGDIPDMRYLVNMVELAKRLPQVQFLAFTKKYELVNTLIGKIEFLPNNLHIVFSAWGNKIDIVNPYLLPIAYVKFKDKSQNANIPKDAIHCSGDCTNCLKCWKITKEQSVVFKKH